ncbi:DUF3301 domain-containing protein [Planctobacterium marinum]|uniref:DUF3301 domain-containing protein n=1 Tax=Planctobacterium marinum TaxID=1631968 RepID=A0AA48HQ55_9ALTE|nr:hypothetical protein MACH26_31480 [Planctobacterium marinum]
MFALSDILFILVTVLVIAQFWRIRAISEAANRYLNLYCEKQGLQLISVARDKTRFGLVRGKPDWKTQFVFEFSGNGEDKYQGVLEMEGHRAVATTVPPYRMN